MARAKIAREWQPAVQELQEDADSTRVRAPEAVLGAFLIVESVYLPGRIVLSLGVLTLLVVLGLTRKPTRAVPGWVPALLGGLLMFVVLGAYANGIDAATLTRRALKIALIMIGAYLLSSGRLHPQSVLKGFGFGLAANAVMFYAGLAPRYYGSALAGWIGDKNRAGLYYAMTTLLLIPLAKKKSSVAILIILGTAAVLGTQSRTSIAGLAFGLLWLVLGSQAGLLARIVLFSVLAWVLQVAEDRFAHIGPFQDRTGSDLLRLEIDQATQAKIATAPWYGLGLGEGRVEVRDSTWFFHDAYATLQIEGGWLFVGGIVVVTVLLGSRVFAPRPIPWAHACSDAATIALLICALRLGDVFLTVPWMLLIGISSVIYPHAAPKADPDEALPPGIESPLKTRPAT